MKIGNKKEKARNEKNVSREETFYLCWKNNFTDVKAR